MAGIASTGDGAADAQIAARKAAQRAAVLERRGRVSDAERAAAGRRLARHVLRLLPPVRSGDVTVAAYCSVGTEPPTGPLLTGLLRRGVRVLLPVVRHDRQLDWARYDGTVTPARWGLREPPGPALGPAAVASADLVVVPALAVDAVGIRLGRGGGFYDRAGSVPWERTVALVYDDELVKRLPGDAHDRPVARVATPGGVLALPRAHWTEHPAAPQT